MGGSRASWPCCRRGRGLCWGLRACASVIGGMGTKATRFQVMGQPGRAAIFVCLCLCVHAGVCVRVCVCVCACCVPWQRSCRPSAPGSSGLTHPEFQHTPSFNTFRWLNLLDLGFAYTCASSVQTNKTFPFTYIPPYSRLTSTCTCGCGSCSQADGRWWHGNF